jgi:crossover junction endonuclease MUS81
MKAGRRRILIQLQTPNPLFEKWIIEWLKEAELKDTQNRHALKKALNSLQKYPLPINSGQDCQILEGFGTKICQMIDAKLEKYKKGNNIIQTPLERNIEVLKQIHDQLLNEETGDHPITAPCPMQSIKMFPNNFQILLLVDTQERIG